jgi:predicted dehydrogenase
MNQGIHTLDLLVWYLGQPLTVSAQMGLLAHRGIEVEDTIAATITFASGAIGTILATTAAYPGLTARLQLHGSHGSAIIDDDELVYLSTGCAARSATPDSADPSARLVDALSRQYDDFRHCIADHVAPRVSVESAAATLDLAAAIYRSARENRPVKVRSLVMSAG